MNLYAYVNNNPLSWIAPWGLAGVCKGRGDDPLYQLTEDQIKKKLKDVAAKYGKNSPEYKALARKAKRILKHLGMKGSRFSKGGKSTGLKGAIWIMIAFEVFQYLNRQSGGDGSLRLLFLPACVTPPCYQDQEGYDPTKNPGDFPPLEPPGGGQYS